MRANTITIACTVLTFAVIALFGHQRALSIALIFTIALIFALDAVDGYIWSFYAIIGFRRGW
ncbi:hypothetical protein F4009_24065 [Candidatus Poribacteria bacterium]|nr:hypothetical protein [Candidatus Poribacteria bacterium]MYA70806.1 hypothetical protein [Candidatus Poribacteria bacterium]MYH83273.1 hypothetical protein [Candidatus Poribacteria bacterium]MYK97034.1 hypothetical protein [Candidatus Poribacteria bacterium]